MQKRLLSLAIAGALAIPGVALAGDKYIKTTEHEDYKKFDKHPLGITVYGKFHASWDFVDNNATAAAGKASDDSDDNTGVFRNSRLGFKGKEKLSDSMNAVWQIETALDTGGDTMKFRNTFIGIEGDQWGTFMFGKHDTPYKTATAKLDIFSDTIADYNNIIGAHITNNVANTNAIGDISSNFNEREPQLVMYKTPEFGGFHAQIARMSYQNDETTAGDDNKEAWSGMAMYDKGPFFASVAYELNKGGFQSITPATNSEDLDAWKIGVGYTFGKTNFSESMISFIYEDIEQDGGGSTDTNIANAAKAASRDAYGVNLAYAFGSNTAKLAYFKADDSDATNGNDGADNWSIGLDHHFSKRTKLYGIYTRMNNDANANYGLYQGQAMAKTKNNTNGFYTGTAAGKDIDAFSFGIIHSF